MTKSDGQNTKFRSEKIKDDKELELKAIKIDMSCFKYVSDELKNNKDIALKMIEK